MFTLIPATNKFDSSAKFTISHIKLNSLPLIGLKTIETYDLITTLLPKYKNYLKKLTRVKIFKHLFFLSVVP